MKSARWVCAALAAAGAIALVAPAAGQGHVAPGWLAWTEGGVATTYYEFPTIASGSHASLNFKLANRGLSGSGNYAVDLTGSPAFSISYTGCTGKSLGERKWCRVAVVYAPGKAGGHDIAVLSARPERGTVATLRISACGAGASGHVYWADSSGGTIKEGLFARGCVTRIKTLVRGQAYPTSVAADGTHVYWTSDGSSPNSGAVEEVPLSGGTVTTLATGQSHPLSVAVDDANVYWVDADYGGGNGTVNSVPLGGGTVTTLASGRDYPSDLAVDGTNVYWVDSSNNGSVNEVPRGGGTVTTLVSDQPYGPLSLAVYGNTVYWAPQYGSVDAVPVGGGKVTTLASGSFSVDALAVDATHVYWVDSYDGTVNELPLGGGSVASGGFLAAGQDSPAFVAVTGAHVYWGSWNAGILSEAPVTGGRVDIVARGQGNSTPVAVGP